jgi:OOP family OmpA-OmpF porin
MHGNRKESAMSVLAVCLLTLVSAFAVSAGEKAKVQGMISGRTGETLIVNSANGKITVVLDDSTKVQDKRGALGIRKKQFSATVLIPGLKVSVDGVGNDQNQVMAKTITFDGDDLETAEMIQAGLHPTAEQVAANQQKIAANQQNISANQQNIQTNQQNIAANKQQIEQNIQDIEENTKRFSELSEYDAKGEATVNFAVSSAKISAQDQAELKQLAQKAIGLTGYIIQVKGFADSSGNAAMNQQLSEDRAQAVVAYLLQNCNVPIRHIVAPGAMGTSYAVASNETKAGRAENRRVEVKVLVNKGIAGK